MNLFIFDINMKNIGFIPPENVVEANVDVMINEAFTMTLTLPTKYDLSDKMRFIATPHPKYKGEYMVGQMARKQINDDLVTYTFREYFYQQLDKGVISVQKPNFTRKPVKDVLNYVLTKPAINWKLVEVMNKNISIYLYYDTGLEVFQRVQSMLGGEFIFTCEIDPKSNDLINHKVRYVKSQGKKTGRRFERDTNLLTLQGDYDYNNIITLVYPRGKGVEVDNPDAPKNAPKGYGRRLTIKDVNPPDPTDPQYNGEYIWDKEATKVWGAMYATRREAVEIFEDIDDAQELYDAGLEFLNAHNHPSAVYQASVTDIDYLDLGDEVYIIWRDEENKHKIEYSTRVFGYHYDLLNTANNTLTLGDQRKNDNLASTLDGMRRKIENAQNMAEWSGQTIIGPDAGMGDKLPSLSEKPREGDTFYLNLKNGLVDMYIFLDGQWVKKASSDASDFANQGKLNGKGKTFYGEANPISPTEGDIWFKYQGQNASQAVMYVYKGKKWIVYNGMRDANGLVEGEVDGYTVNMKNLNASNIVVGSIDASKINVLNLNASNITAGALSADRISGGTIDASKINVVKINASNITAGIISGANLSINLGTGAVNFKKGRITSTDQKIDINIDQSYISVKNGTGATSNNVLIRNGEISFTQPNIFDPSNNPYLRITNGIVGSSFASATIQARQAIELNVKGYTSSVVEMGQETLAGIKYGVGNDNKLQKTLIGGASEGVKISGGTIKTGMLGVSPNIWVGRGKTINDRGNRILINAEYVHIQSVYSKTSSGTANVLVAADGAMVRVTSARKYKTNIKQDVSTNDAEKLLEVPLSTWDDIAELKEYGKSKRYFGMIAEDVAEAGLDYLVQRDDETNEIEGLNYDRIALLLVPMVKQMKERIEVLEDKLGENNE